MNEQRLKLLEDNQNLVKKMKVMEDLKVELEKKLEDKTKQLETTFYMLKRSQEKCDTLEG